jgi:hypothetical protein
VNPLGIPKKEPILDNGLDRAAHHKKVKQWFLNSSKYCKGIEQEQKKYPDKCIFHLSKSHPTADCNVKKECDKLIHSKKSSSIPSYQTVKTGTLCHITEEIFEDAAEVVVSDSHINEVPDNDTNEDALLYFAHVSKHYLCLVKSSLQNDVTPRHDMKYPVIADSGANFHMFNDEAFFTSILPARGQVILGDGKTSLPIKGVGTVKCYIDGNLLTIPDVCYVSDLSESIYSMFLHIRQPDHGIQSSFDTGLIIQFPSFDTKALIGQNDVYIDALPIPTKEGLPVSVTPLVSSSTMDTVPFCRNIKQFQNNLHQVTTQLDNLLYHLHQYYDLVHTKHQLNLEVPAGFRKTTSHQKMFQEFTPPQKTGISSHDTTSSLNDFTPLDEEITLPGIDPGVHPNISATMEKPSSITDTTKTSSNAIPIPIIRSVNKPSTSLPTTIMMSEDHLHA